MLYTLTFHHGDIPLAQKLAAWIAEMGGVKHHKCLLVTMKDTPTDGILEPLQEAFESVQTYVLPDKDPKEWPLSQNLVFRRVARQVEAVIRTPFLWGETDAIPLVSDWLDQIEAAYRSCGKPFMGAYVDRSCLPEEERNREPFIPHMSGIAVYPPNAPGLAPKLVTCEKMAFDVASAPQVLPRMAKTGLIAHRWKAKPFERSEDLARIPEGAVIFHQNKGGDLIDLLRYRQLSTAKLPDGYTLEVVKLPGTFDTISIPPLAEPGKVYPPDGSIAWPEHVPNPAYASASHTMDVPGVYVERAEEDRKSLHPAWEKQIAATTTVKERMLLASPFVNAIAAISDRSPRDKGAIRALLREAGLTESQQSKRRMAAKKKVVA